MPARTFTIHLEGDTVRITVVERTAESREPDVAAQPPLGRASDGRTASFRWDEVERIDAWKEDLFAADRIWLEFTLTDRDSVSPSVSSSLTTTVRVHEETEGYTQLLAEMERRCIGLTPNWWRQVAFPAFETSRTLICKRSAIADVERKG